MANGDQLLSKVYCQYALKIKPLVVLAYEKNNNLSNINVFKRETLVSLGGKLPFAVR